MCGISGIIALAHDATLEMNALHRMSDRQRHRGPDDEGFLAADIRRRSTVALRGDDTRLADGVDPTRVPHIHSFDGSGYHIGFAHRRLSILDPTLAGHQPMSSADGRYHLIYNGEVYNFVELRKDLERQGWRFRSSSDTEVVLAALATWGVTALPLFVGMFAFAWLDLVLGKIVLARDAFGIKPLYYAEPNGLFAFASEPSAILELSSISRTIDANTAYAYLRYGITDHEEGTFFKAIRQIPPAHSLTIDLRSGRVESPVRYWDADETNGPMDYREATEQLRSRFLESVHLHLRSDVPVAVMLSGGIDSSAVSLAARQSLGDASRLAAFGYVAREERVNEQRWMRIVADAGNMELHEVHPSMDDMASMLESVIASQQSPFGGLSILAQASVFRSISESGFKVVLSGQGADELLGGYAPFAAARLASLVRAGHWLKASRFFGHSRQWPGWRSMTIGLLQQLLPQAVQHPIRSATGHNAAPAWLESTWFRNSGVALGSPRSSRNRSRDVLKTALRDCVFRTSLPELLRYEDRNSMAYSVESRVPFLATSLVSYLLSLPEQFIYGDKGCSKAIFRDAMRGLVPDSVLDRRDKISFSAPMRQWFTSLRPWIDRILRSDTLAQLPMFRRDVIIGHWNRVLEERTKPDNQLWRWVNFTRWAEVFHAVPSVSTP